MATAKHEIKDLQRLKAVALVALMKSASKAMSEGKLVQLTGLKK